MDKNLRNRLRKSESYSLSSKRLALFLPSGQSATEHGSSEYLAPRGGVFLDRFAVHLVRLGGKRRAHGANEAERDSIVKYDNAVKKTVAIRNSAFNLSRIMADLSNKYPENVAGAYYCDDQCIDCDLCRETAPANFTRNDDGGHSYVFKQPETPEEEALCKEAMEGCPVEAIGNDAA